MVLYLDVGGVTSLQRLVLVSLIVKLLCERLHRARSIVQLRPQLADVGVVSLPFRA